MIIRIIYLLGASIVTIIQFETVSIVSKGQELSEYILGFPSLGIITSEERHLF